MCLTSAGSGRGVGQPGHERSHPSECRSTTQSMDAESGSAERRLSWEAQDRLEQEIERLCGRVQHGDRSRTAKAPSVVQRQVHWAPDDLENCGRAPLPRLGLRPKSRSNGCSGHYQLAGRLQGNRTLIQGKTGERMPASSLRSC